MTYEVFLRAVTEMPAPVVLLEGTRQLPPDDTPHLVALGRMLARDLPTARFRTGNASGSDDAFAEGVAQVAPSRLEYVVPFATSRIEHRRAHNKWVSLEDLTPAKEAELAEQTVQATSYYKNLIEKRHRNREARIKAPYLIRDTLKVTGAAEVELAPATWGVFYLHPDNPTQGGTAHTRRVCEMLDVPTIAQGEWLVWLSRKELSPL